MTQAPLDPKEAGERVAGEPSAMASLLLFVALREARRQKWILSEQEGHDVGPEAVVEWFRRNFRHWYRDHWVEHICGKAFWQEFGPEQFDLAHKDGVPDAEMLGQIVESVSRYGENLGIVVWACDSGQDLGRVVEVLRRLGINEHRAEVDERNIRALAEALDEADKYKWEESERAGFDVGEQAIQDWFRSCWAEWYERHA